VKIWQKSVIITLISLTIGGIYLFSVWRHRQNPGVEPQNEARQTLSQDQLAVVREFFPAHFEDTRRLEGTTVWMKDGYVMPYYPYANGHVLFAKPLGVIAAAQRLEVKKIVKAAVPASVDDRIEHGSRQALAIFAMPGGAALYATPIGYQQGGEEAYYTDLLFYYDDPQAIYDHWPKSVWAAIDAHQVKPGMSELETFMSIGRNLQSGGATEGNRTVTFDQAGRHWTITYEKNRATAIKSE
jgi:hypothetical protein